MREGTFDDGGDVGTDTCVIVGKHDVFRCGALEGQIAVGGQALSFVFVEQHVGAVHQLLGYEFKVAFVGVLIGNQIPNLGLRWEENVNNSHDALVDGANQNIESHSNRGEDVQG